METTIEVAVGKVVLTFYWMEASKTEPRSPLSPAQQNQVRNYAVSGWRKTHTVPFEDMVREVATRVLHLHLEGSPEDLHLVEQRRYYAMLAVVALARIEFL